MQNSHGKVGKLNMGEKYVWYTCYGSNMLKERFMHYIKGGTCIFNDVNYRGCADKSDPVDERPFTIPHRLYFAMSSGKWGGGGIAFLDPEIDESAKTLGKIYKVTYDQFLDIKNQEGKVYDRDVDLGEVDGIPVKTFTHSYVAKETRPSAAYVNVIRLGLKETYPDMPDEEIEQYLENRIMTE